MVTEEKKVAIVCDWLTGIGGAELVVLELHRMFPNAPIYTSQYDPSKINWFHDADVRTTWLNKLPSKLRKLYPVLRAYSFSRLDLSNYDLVISSSGAEAKAIKTGPRTTHISYCHSPTHYYWTRYDAYMRRPGWGSFDFLARIGLKLLVGPMRKWDFKAAQKPKVLIANSSYTQANITKFYKRSSTVIFPPVDVKDYSNARAFATKRSGFIVVGRQTPYKRIDLAVRACTKLNLELTVIGDGPENTRLKHVAGPTIKFLGQISDAEKAEHLASSKGFIFPGVDDFGIAAVEALAAGTPVIAFAQGGVMDYINDNNGVLFGNQNPDSLGKALTAFNSKTFDEKTVQASASNFSIEIFRQNITNLINSL